MPVRLSKITLVFSISVYMFFVVLNNITDYQSNYLFVSNVMSMSESFSETIPNWRSVSKAPLHHVFYVVIIVTEALILGLCLIGVWRMWANKQASKAHFSASKKYAIYGLTLGVALWFIGFAAIGGEWFLMWQSDVWNGVSAAYRNSIFFTLALIFISGDNEKETNKT